MPSRRRVAARRVASNANAAASMPFGITTIRPGGTPQPRRRAATVGDTATVADPSRSVARYSARTPRDGTRPSMWPSPSECSVAMTRGVPARRAAMRP